MSFVTLSFGQSGLHSCTTFLSFIFFDLRRKIRWLENSATP